VKAMHLGETRYGAKDFVPASTNEILRPGTYYLMKVDDLYRRSYARKPSSIDSVKSNGVLANGNGAHA
jgi:hydroxymethylglutaryl-CoA synthase